MKNWSLVFYLCMLVASLSFTACSNEPGDDGPSETDFTDLLSNQVDGVIIPTMVSYQGELANLGASLNVFDSNRDQESLDNLRSAFQNAYLAYQAAAVHNYFATINQNLVMNTNLYPIDISILESLIENESYNFNTSAQERANGFPAIDYLLYGPENVLAYLTNDAKPMNFLKALVTDMKTRADALVDQWSGNLKTNFIGNGGTALGSSISVQLNESLVYYEVHIRENKVGIPIGLLGPNDSPIAPDATKIEAYYQALKAGNETFTLSLLRAAIQEMEDLYLGDSGQGYDDLLIARNQASIDTDIKAQFNEIYNQISNRSSISGDENLFQSIQGLVTLFKSDLFPILNVQDADGANDGD